MKTLFKQVAKIKYFHYAFIVSSSSSFTDFMSVNLLTYKLYCNLNIDACGAFTVTHTPMRRGKSLSCPEHTFSC